VAWVLGGSVVEAQKITILTSWRDAKTRSRKLLAPRSPIGALRNHGDSGIQEEDFCAQSGFTNIGEPKEG
jgi:hypothetical protein